MRNGMPLTILVIVFLCAGVFVFLRAQKPTPLSTIAPVKDTISNNTDPFYELTIPFLRSKDFQSTLGELTLYQKRANYTSYLTTFASDGLRVNGLLTIPNTTGPHPAIVFVHGYIAPSVYKTTERYGDYVDALASSGFVVFKIDLRGNGESEGEPGGAYYSSDYVVDTLSAYAALASESFVNADKIGLWGHSMAGNVVMRAFVAKQTIPAVVIWAGAGYSYRDLQKYGLQDNSYRPQTNNAGLQQKRAQLRALHGEFTENDPFWRQVAPTNYLNDVKGALEIHHAVDDSVVNIGYSRDLIALLDTTNVNHQLFEYETGGHNIANASFSVAMKRTIDFYNKYFGVK